MFSQSVGGQFVYCASCVSQAPVRRPLLSSILHEENERIYAQLSWETPALGMTTVVPAVNNPFMGFEGSEFDGCWSCYSNQPCRNQTFLEARQWNNVGSSSENFIQAGPFYP